MIQLNTGKYTMHLISNLSLSLSPMGMQCTELLIFIMTLIHIGINKYSVNASVKVAYCLFLWMHVVCMKKKRGQSPQQDIWYLITAIDRVCWTLILSAQNYTLYCCQNFCQMDFVPFKRSIDSLKPQYMGVYNIVLASIMSWVLKWTVNWKETNTLSDC